MRKFLQRADEPVFFEDEQFPVIVADGVESCWAIGNDVHVTYWQDRQAFVDGALQTRRKTVGCLIIKPVGLMLGRKIITRVVESLPRESNELFWHGSGVN